MEFHPVALLFPAMSDDDLQELADDIQERGLLDPIVTWRGKVIEGRHRLAACRLAGVEPVFEEWNGRGSLIAFVRSKNLKRRHLTPSQRATSAAKLADAMEREAEWLAAPKPAINAKNNSAQACAEFERRGPGRPSRSKNAVAAKECGASVRATQQARQIMADAPEVFEAVDRGEVSLHEAAEQVRGPAPVDGETIRNRALASLLDVERALGDLCETEAGGNVNRDKALAALFRLRSLIVGGARKVARRGPFNPAEIDLPVELDTEAFRAKWREWCEYRADKRKPVSAVAAARSLEKCRAAGAEAACRAIDDAIAADWQGLFPKANGAADANDKLAGVREILSGPSRPRRGQTVAPGVELLEGGGDGLPW